MNKSELIKYNRYAKELQQFVYECCNATLDNLWTEIFQPLAQEHINNHITLEADNVYYDVIYTSRTIILSIKLDMRFFDVVENESNEIFYFELPYAANYEPHYLEGVQSLGEMQEIFTSIQNHLNSQTHFETSTQLAINIGLHILRAIRNINLKGEQILKRYSSDTDEVLVENELEPNP
jgi:hypothetical protein